MIPWIRAGSPPDSFPDPETALVDPDGLLAAGGDLGCDRLREAYRRGIFPWYSDGQPILWWSPDPRTVFRPGNIHLSRRLARWLRGHRCELVIDGDFPGVVAACAAPRDDDAGTWITDEMGVAYERLFEEGTAHCAEARLGGRTLGGVYGVAMGRVFFGESMFSAETNGSKVALIGLGRWLARCGYRLIDAQVASGHLGRLGAEHWTREKFLDALALWTAERPEQTLGPATIQLAELLPD